MICIINDKWHIMNHTSISVSTTVTIVVSVSIVPCLGRLQIGGGILGVSHDDQSYSDEQGDLQKEIFNLNEKDNPTGTLYS